jgi:hypothetical protein
MAMQISGADAKPKLTDLVRRAELTLPHRPVRPGESHGWHKA